MSAARTADVLLEGLNDLGIDYISVSYTHLNRGAVDVLYLEVGDRSAGDLVDYPDDDLRAEPGPDGKRRMVRKDGTPV